MILQFTPQGWDEYADWLLRDRRMLAKLNTLLNDALRHPFEGLGKPEPLKNEFAGCWSRRINDEHRLVYRVQGEVLLVLQCRYHY